MNQITTVIDRILEVDGYIRVLPFDPMKHDSCNEIILWRIDTSNSVKITRYGDLSWQSAPDNRAITFHNASPKLTYELKALALGMLTLGVVQGGEPLKWNTIRGVIQHSKKFGIWLNGIGVNSLSELDQLSSLKLRNLILKYLTDTNANKITHAAYCLFSVIYWLKSYRLLTSESNIAIFHELLSPYIEQKKRRRKKHSIIPTRVMKLMLSQSESALIDAIKHYRQWKKIQIILNNRISRLKSDSFSKGTSIKLQKWEREELDFLHQYYENVKSHIFVLVLAYSGMRHSEALALEDGAYIVHNGDYYVTSKLSKTTDGQQELEWVVSKSAFMGVKLISKMNAIYRERAELIRKYHSHALPQTRYTNTLFGTKNRGLFNVRHCKSSCSFGGNHHGRKTGFPNFSGLFPIPVTDTDIKALDRLGCNYQSVSHNGKGFREPYKVGVLFNFTSHQFRHTFAWFIVANRLGDLDDIKYQFKHLDSSMTLVYSHRGYDSMEELLRLTESFEEYLTEQAMTDIVAAAESHSLAGKGGQKFIERLQNILGGDFENGASPHFGSMKDLLEFTAKHSPNFRGLSHGYCTKGNSCKVRNAADPSHCINCDSYIATPKHLPHWLVIKQKCESQLASFELLPNEIKPRFSSFRGALIDNLHAANSVIEKLQLLVKEA